MSVVIITGSSGLIGSEAALFYGRAGYDIVGIDNNMRSYFFGKDGSTLWNRRHIKKTLGAKYKHFNTDIRDKLKIQTIFSHYKKNIALVIHTAAQPSHDWAVKEPITDFTINSLGTLILLETMRKYCPEAVFIFTSTNKVYGDNPNKLPLKELETRWEIETVHPYYRGIPENMSVDQNTHSLFGVSKLAADLLVQEYGKYFGLKTVCFRGGVLTGHQHSGVVLHGFLSYLMKCAMAGITYTIIGYKGKQVRDIIHSSDVVSTFNVFLQNPKIGEVYNLGGGRESNISVLEAIKMAQEITGKKMQIEYTDQNRKGDHIWYISDLTKFKTHYPEWKLKYYNVNMIMEEIYQANKKRWYLND